MSSKNLHRILLGLITLMLIGMVAGTFSIHKLMAGKADKLLALKTQSQALEKEQTSLRQAKKDIAKYADLDKIAHTVVPEDKNQAEAVREIINIAKASGIQPSIISFPASSLGGSAVSGASSGTATAPSVNPNSKTTKLSQLLPVKNMPGVYQLQITVSTDPDHAVLYGPFINFLAGLERNRRTAQVSSITLEPDQNNRELLSFTLVLNEYIKP